MKRIIVLIVAGFLYHHLTPAQRAYAWDYVETQVKYYTWEGVEKVGAWVGDQCRVGQSLGQSQAEESTK
jgi:hypothetical protein